MEVLGRVVFDSLENSQYTLCVARSRSPPFRVVGVDELSETWLDGKLELGSLGFGLEPKRNGTIHMFG